MKTTMTEMIEWLQAYEYEIPLELQVKAKELLEKEKEQIIEFGYKCRNKCRKESTILPQDIFNQTYNQNK